MGKTAAFELQNGRGGDIIHGSMKKVFAAAGRFIKGEVVLCIAILAAIISMFFVPPDSGYSDYIDWDTLALLFALMGVMKGFQAAGLFSFLAGKLLKKADTPRKLAAVLVFLPFVLSMLVTNDVSLITFVPFGIIVLKAACMEKMIIPVVVLQTLAANLGSTLTPMGNPQNLYLYNSSGMSFGDVIITMLPYAVLSAVMLAVAVLFFKGGKIECVQTEATLGSKFSLIWPAVGFAVCLTGLFDLLSPLIIAAAMLVFLIIFDRKSLIKIDYSLLGTFIALFIFIGNMGRIEAFRSFIEGIIEGNEVVVSVLASQIISNVPAALLLSGFSTHWTALMIGCNLGGLGTLIASMASLISYKSLAKEYPEKRAKYLLWFTIFNVIFLAALLALYFILSLIIK